MKFSRNQEQGGHFWRDWSMLERIPSLQPWGWHHFKESHRDESPDKSINHFITLRASFILLSPFQKRFQLSVWATFGHLTGDLGIFWISRLLFLSCSGAKPMGFIFSLCSCPCFINTGILRQNNNSVKMDQPQWRQSRDGLLSLQLPSKCLARAVGPSCKIHF